MLTETLAWFCSNLYVSPCTYICITGDMATFLPRTKFIENIFYKSNRHVRYLNGHPCAFEKCHFPRGKQVKY